jgi:hypothetical protein
MGIFVALLANRGLRSSILDLLSSLQLSSPSLHSPPTISDWVSVAITTDFESV